MDPSFLLTSWKQLEGGMIAFGVHANFTVASDIQDLVLFLANVGYTHKENVFKNPAN